jgi:hypothetical protein
MITDTNSVVGFAGNMLGGLLGTDSLVMLGIVFFLCIAVAMIWARLKAGTSVMIGAVMAVMLSFVAPEFGFLFWLAILASLVVLINALRKMWTGY